MSGAKLILLSIAVSGGRLDQYGDSVGIEQGERGKNMRGEGVGLNRGEC